MTPSERPDERSSGAGFHASDELLHINTCLQAIAAQSPEVGMIALTLQGLEVLVDYGGDPATATYKTLAIRAQSRITFEDGRGCHQFRPPVDDPAGTIPSRLFTTQGERVMAIGLDATSLKLTTERSTFEFSHSDGMCEAIELRDGRGAEAWAYL